MEIFRMPPKAPDERIDYGISFKKLLAPTGDSIASGGSFTVTIDAGITEYLRTYDLPNGTCIVWLSGGTAGMNYNVSVEAATVMGRILRLDVAIPVRNPPEAPYEDG